MSKISEFEITLQDQGLERVELGRRYDSTDDATVLNLSNYPPYLKLGQTILKMEVQERGKLEAVTFSVFTENSTQQNRILLPERSITLPTRLGKHIWLGRGEEGLSRDWIHLDDPSASKRHAEVDTLSDVSLIRDLGSTNGTVLYVHPNANYDKYPVVFTDR